MRGYNCAMDATELDLDRELSLTAMRGAYQAATTNSSIVVTLECTSTVTETIDFYPYGGQRVDTKTAPYVGENNKYAQTIYDSLSGLNYAQARYQNSSRGQFISQDPVFWRKQNLADPQSLNSYGYASDNPISKSDPSGLLVSEFQPYLASNGSAYGPYNTNDPLGAYRGITI